MKVEGGASVESLLKRGWMLLGDHDWDSAAKTFDNILNMDAENGEAYSRKILRRREDTNHWRICQKIASIRLNRRKAATSKGRFISQTVPSGQSWSSTLLLAKRESGDYHLFEIVAGASCEGYSVHCNGGGNHTAGLHIDGTVVTTAKYYKKVSNWQNIRLLQRMTTLWGCIHGTVVVDGNNADQCAVENWRDIVAISEGGGHTVGLRADGTVVAVGCNDEWQCDVGCWRNIVAVSAGCEHTVGLRTDGTVVAVGSNSGGQCDVQGWKLCNHFDTIEWEREEVHVASPEYGRS